MITLSHGPEQEELILSLLSGVKRIARDHSLNIWEREDLASLGMVKVIEEVVTNWEVIQCVRDWRPYLLATAKHAMINYHRHGHDDPLRRPHRTDLDRDRPATVLSLDLPTGPEDERLLRDTIPDEDNTSSVSSQSERKARALHAAISRLPEHQQCIVRIFYGLNGNRLSSRQMATLLHLPRTTIESRLQAALKRLRRDPELLEVYAC